MRGKATPVDPVSKTPTDTRHYALLTGAYAALAGALALSAARHREGDDLVPSSPGELALYSLATAGVTRLLSAEKVGAWVRAPFVDEPPGGEQRPRGRGLRYTVGELLTCTRCLGSWSALGLLAARAVAPQPTRVAATLFALSYVNGVLQSGFAAVRGTAHAREEVAGKVAAAPPEAVAAAAAAGAGHDGHG
jgi:hypothetical protein